MKQEIKTLLRSNPALYYGFTGCDNLGDEAIWQATEMQFRMFALYSVRMTRFDFINNLIYRKKKKLVILGGGTLIGDNLANGSNPFRERYLYFSKNTNCRVVFGTGVGSANGCSQPPGWLQQWKPILTDCAYIGVRGRQSQNTLKTIGIESEVIGDSACSWARSKRIHVQKKILGINIGASKGLLPIDKMNIYAQFIKKKHDAGWNIQFYIINPDDYIMTKTFSNECGIDNPELITIYNDTEQYLNKVSEAYCFIGTRLHSVVLAMCVGVPSIMIGYAAKAYDFMESIGMEQFSVSAPELTVVELDRLFETLLSDPSSISNEMLNGLMGFKNIQRVRAKQICANL